MPAGIGFGFGISIKGDKDLIRKLDRLAKINKRGRDKVIRQAVSAAMTPVNKAAKAKAPIGTTTTFPGLLKKSIGKKAKTYRQSIFVVIVGPRRGFRKPTGKVSKDGKPLFQNPAKYAHFEELGVTSRGIPPRPFLRPALFENRQKSVGILRTKLAVGIIREAKKK